MTQRAGWYDDPEDPEYLRYFDGIIWTANRQPKASPTAARSSIGYAAAPGMPGGPAAGGPADPRGPQGPYGQQGQQGQQPQQGQQGQQGWGQTPQGPYPGQQGHPGQQGWGQGPQYGAPYGGPQHGAPYGTPQYGPPQHGAPYGAPQYGAPQYGAPQYGAPQYGAPYAGGYLGAGVKTTPDGMVLAGWGRRLGAYVIDRAIEAVLVSIAGAYWLNGLVQWYVSFIQQTMADAEAGRTTTPPGMSELQGEIMQYIVPLVLVGIAVTLVYQVGFLTWRGATPGKMVLGMQVRRRDRPGNPPLGTALLRQVIPVGSSLLGLLPLLSLLGTPLGWLDNLWPLWDDKNQALHDKLAGTNVVMKPQHRG